MSHELWVVPRLHLGGGYTGKTVGVCLDELRGESLGYESNPGQSSATLVVPCWEVLTQLRAVAHILGDVQLVQPDGGQQVALAEAGFGEAGYGRGV